MNDNGSAASGGIGFTGVLQIVFIVLKLCKVINWSWWAVMLPAIIWAGIGVIVLIVFAVWALGLYFGWW